MEHTVVALIDKLIACWSDWDSYEEYYLNVLAPSIVRSGPAKLKGIEKEIVTELRPLLSQGEWQQLPTLIARRRVSKLEELKVLREAKLERERRERERRLAEEAQRQVSKRKELEVGLGLPRFHRPFAFKPRRLLSV